ncbi:MAG TPA: selenite/tellurite reduction operon b-type cytochrome iron-sulfur cluster-binding subunit ExtO [Desulfuromonadaceae bacterium]
MRLKTVFIAVCLTAVNALSAPAGENRAGGDHRALQGVHRALSCASCHLSGEKGLADPAAASHGARGCTACHQGYAALFSHAMGTRRSEREFVGRSYGRVDPRFFEKNCSSCHLKGCLDCHGGNGHSIIRGTGDSCYTCHKGYYTGSDFRGLAPREENMRYQRGRETGGERYLKMLPDAHFRAGFGCAECHSMASLVDGRKTAKGCRDCHRVSRRPVEHRIAAHLTKLECYACHSAWGAQEYGSFFLRFTDSKSREAFDLKWGNGEYLRSVYLKRQDAPPLGLNARGLVSPIRPQFIAYFTAVAHDRSVGTENRLLAAEWRAFFPHTVQRGTVMCEGCHDSPRRFILERPEDRIYDLTRDGMTLASFWERKGQRVVNGAFFPAERFRTMTGKGPAYRRAYVEKWKSLANHVDTSSPR